MYTSVQRRTDYFGDRQTLVSETNLGVRTNDSDTNYLGNGTRAGVIRAVIKRRSVTLTVGLRLSHVTVQSPTRCS